MRVGFCVGTACAAMLWAGVPRAETEAEYGNPGPASATLPGAAAPLPKPARTGRPAVFAAAAAAQATRMTMQQREERQFLKDAAAANRFQAEAARMAVGKSSAGAVRALAADQLENRSARGNELLRMLHRRSLAAPMLGNDQRRTLNRLARLQGARFDRLFVEQVVLNAQRSELLYYEKAGASAGDPQLKAWIARTLPAFRDQIATAERVAAPEVKMARGAGSPGAARQSAPRHAPIAARTSELNSR
jgi:putative membrane protein